MYNENKTKQTNFIKHIKSKIKCDYVEKNKAIPLYYVNCIFKILRHPSLHPYQFAQRLHSYFHPRQ